MAKFGDGQRRLRLHAPTVAGKVGDVGGIVFRQQSCRRKQIATRNPKTVNVYQRQSTGWSRVDGNPGENWKPVDDRPSFSKFNTLRGHGWPPFLKVANGARSAEKQRDLYDDHLTT